MDNPEQVYKVLGIFATVCTATYIVGYSVGNFVIELLVNKVWPKLKQRLTKAK